MYPKRPLYLTFKNKMFQLYFIGLKGFFEAPRRRGYRAYLHAAVLLGSLLGLKYLLHGVRTEFEILNNPNFLIPRFVYQSREDHYRYWELSRLSRQKSALFSFYDYDPVSDFMFYYYDSGMQLSEKNYLNIEKLENVNNPLFEKYIREFRQSQTRESLIKGNLLSAYNKNIGNPLELKNYLHFKTVNLGDWIRALYYTVMVQLRLTNYYRYDHIMARDDRVYDYEKLKIAMNLPHKKRGRRIAKYAKIFDNANDLVLLGNK